MRSTLSIALVALALAGCRVDGDFDADPDGDVDGDADESRVQFCPPEGGDSGFTLCAPDAGCCTAGEEPYCCPVPATVCTADGGCREPCDERTETVCDADGEGAFIECSPEGDGVIACSPGGECWGRLLRACEAGTCQVVGGVVGCW